MPAPTPSWGGSRRRFICLAWSIAGWHGGVPAVLQHSLADHAVILSALERRDADASAGALAQHMRNVHRSTANLLKRGTAKPKEGHGVMRSNPVKTSLAAGGLAYGTMVFEFFTPGMAQIMAASGAEFAIFDTEHSAVGIETIKAQMAYARFTGCVPLVRVGSITYHSIAATLDAGALGIMAPMVESAEQAAFLVSCTRYPPVGRRGAAFGVAHDDYIAGDVVANMRAADERTLVIALIETVPGLENVEAIAAVPGIDVLWLGHFDLTNSMGIPGEFEHPRFNAAVARIAAAAQSHGRSAGMMVADEAWARRFRGQGFRMLAYGVDHMVFQSALSTGIAAMRAIG